MVKSPRIRHSKPRRDPVTIDLEANEVENKSPGKPADTPSASHGTGSTTSMAAKAADAGEAAKDSAAKPGASGSTARPEASGKADASSAASATAGKDAPQDKAAVASPMTSATSADRKDDPTKPASGKGPASGSTSFGRDAGKASSVPPSGTTSTGSSAPPPRAAASRVEPAAAPRGSVSGSLMAGVAGAVLALLGAGALQFAGILPSPNGRIGQSDVATLQDEVASLRQQIETLPTQGSAPEGLAERVEALSQALEDARADFTASGGALQADPAAARALEDRFAALESAIAALPRAEGGAPVDLAPINERIGAAETAAAEAGRNAQQASQAAADAASAAQATGQRIDQLEQAVTGLTTRVDEQAEQPQAALAIAASALKAAIDRGEPFTTELDTFAAVAPDAAETEPLRAMAASGVPSRTAIAAEFDTAASAMLAAGRTIDPNAGILDRLMSSAESLVQVRPVGDVQGEGAPAAIARMEVAVEKGDYAAALTEYEALPAPAKEAGSAYAGKLRARLAADELMDKVLAAALKA